MNSMERKGRKLYSDPHSCPSLDDFPLHLSLIFPSEKKNKISATILSFFISEK